MSAHGEQYECVSGMAARTQMCADATALTTTAVCMDTFSLNLRNTADAAFHFVL